MDLTGCSEEQAIAALEKYGDVFEAVLSLTPGSKIAIPKKVELDDTQKFFRKVGREMTTLTDSITKGYVAGQEGVSTTASDQSAPSEHYEMQILPEGTALQSSCHDKCPPPSLESVVQIPEIVYPSPSESIYDLQLNGQT